MKLAGSDAISVEGCGSIPDGSYAVKRKSYVVVSGYTLNKNYLEMEYGSEDFIADKEPVFASFNTREWIVQHELDHLDGRLIIDYLSKLKRISAVKKWKAALREESTE